MVLSSTGVAGGRSGEQAWAKGFFTIWTGQAFSLVGSALVQFALMLWLADVYRSAILLTAAAIMGILPQVFISPFAGAYVDRLNRRRVMIAADALTALATFLLMASFALGTIAIWQIFIVLFFRSAMQGFHWPAMQASTTLMVPEEHLGRVGGLNQTILGLSTIMAPVLGALLYVALPMMWVLSVDLLTAALAIVALLLVRIPEVRKAARKAGATVLSDLKEAFRYLHSWKGIMAVVVIFSLINFLINPAFTLYSLLTFEYFMKGPYEVAIIEAMAGAGAIIGGVALGIWGGGKRMMVTCMAALAVSGVGVLIIGLLPPDGYFIAVIATLVVGLAIAMVNGTTMAIMQKGIRPDMQGRTFALLGSIASGMSPLGLVLAGPISDTFGIQVWFIVGGVVMAAIGVLSFFFPLIMRLEDREREPVPLEPVPPSIIQ